MFRWAQDKNQLDRVATYNGRPIQAVLGAAMIFGEVRSTTRL
jgi:hypothetical protein